MDLSQQHKLQNNKSDLRLGNKWLYFFQRDSVIATALFLISLGLLSLDWRYSLSNGNFFLQGGVSTVGSERVLNGEMPYLDFWTMYAPGHFYLLASLLKIFGNHLLVEVIAASVVSAASAVVIFLIGRKLFSNRLLALIPAGVFLAVMYNTGYFRRLGSYPAAIFLVFMALYFLVRYYRAGRTGLLIASGIMVGLAVIFKHDVAGYTALAITVGLLIYQVSKIKSEAHSYAVVWRELLVFAAAILFVSVPVMAYFAVRAWPHMFQNLVVFPLTDFRYARPEGYPGLLPAGLLGETPLLTLKKIFKYISFNIPFLLTLNGLISVIFFIKDRHPVRAAMGATFVVAYFLHYSAAHIQINTHIVTMSVYAIWLGILAFDLIQKKNWLSNTTFLKAVGIVLMMGWLIAVVAQPGYLSLVGWQTESTNVPLPKVSGFKLTPEEVETYEKLINFVNQHVPPDQAIFVGLHRHDVVVIGDVMVYFILDRPIATRYSELHPAITDTQPTQREIIGDIQDEGLDYIILRHIFPDHVLEDAKADFLENLPYIGATDLDEFIKNNFIQVEQFGPYTIWERNSS
jgi:hypothetical protein